MQPVALSLAALALAAVFLVAPRGAALAAPPATQTTNVRLNSIGYPPDAAKHASIIVAATDFAITRVKDGAKVLEGKVTGPVTADTKEQVWLADFSALKEAGEYQLDVPGVGSSPPFRIAADVYEKPFYVATRAMYLWRCGIAVKAEYNGNVFAHDACHMDDAWLDLATGKHEKKDGTRGWHDAGDYNKYVLNGAFTAGMMMQAWEDFPAMHGFKLDIPETGGKIPDYLAEIKWEMDWLLTMQADDGKVYHKLTTKGFGGFILPEKEKAERYFTPWGSAATADLVAALAQFSRLVRPYDADYADKCLAAAKKSWDFLVANPANHDYDHAGTSTGGYDAKDPQHRLWAAAELWETTGDADVLKDLETRIAQGNSGRFDFNFDWGNLKDMGLLTYALSKREGRDEALLARVRQSLTGTADAMVKAAQGHAYGRPLVVYYWGCNGAVARQAMVLQAANKLAPKPEYTATCLDALNHIFGRNYYGRSYVTGLGFKPPMKPHDRRSGGDTVVDPWPGYLVGGPQKGTDWQDEQGDFRTNEICLNWNGPLIYALAGFVKVDVQKP